MSAILGNKQFKEWVYDKLLPELTAEGRSRVVQPNLSIPFVTAGVAAYYQTNSDDLRKICRGRQQENEARKVAMYLCQELSAAKLREIADYFNLNNPGSVSFITHQTREKKSENKGFKRKVNDLIKSLISQAS